MDEHRQNAYFFTLIKMASKASWDKSDTSLPPGAFQDTLAYALKAKQNKSNQTKAQQLICFLRTATWEVGWAGTDTSWQGWAVGRGVLQCSPELPLGCKHHWAVQVLLPDSSTSQKLTLSSEISQLFLSTENFAKADEQGALQALGEK